MIFARAVQFLQLNSNSIRAVGDALAFKKKINRIFTIQKMKTCAIVEWKLLLSRAFTLNAAGPRFSSSHDVVVDIPYPSHTYNT